MQNFLQVRKFYFPDPQLDGGITAAARRLSLPPGLSGGESGGNVIERQDSEELLYKFI
jgi:hypothetical protein